MTLRNFYTLVGSLEPSWLAEVVPNHGSIFHTTNDV
jgi:hypothetical protein